MNNSNRQSKFAAHDPNEPYAHGDNSHNNIENNHPSHSHAALFRDKGGKVLFWCMIITFTFALIEGVGGYLIKSIALQTDAVHMMTDSAGLMIAYFANKVSQRPATVNLSFGYGKAEVLGALINCMFTTVLTVWLLFEVIGRFFNPVAVPGGSLFILASIGLIVNAGVVWVLSKQSNSLNTKAALLHALGDLLASFAAILAGAIIYFTGLSIFDPILSLVVIVILIVSNFRIIKKSIIILMAGVPDYLDYEQIGKDLSEIAGIMEVHDLHIWYISANKAALSAHVVAARLQQWPEILVSCQKMLLEKYQIDHITLQHEFSDLQCKQESYCGDKHL